MSYTLDISNRRIWVWQKVYCHFLDAFRWENYKTYFLWAFQCILNLNYLAPSIGERNGIRLQYSCLEIPMDSLVGCSPWGRSESDTTERLHFHFSLSCIGEGNGNPLHCSCLENPRDGGAWWAAVYGVAQSWTRLKRLSSSSSSSSPFHDWSVTEP